jgi:hypothetical protein
MPDTKSGKRHETATRLKSWQEACGLGFCGDLGEWERLLGAGRSADQGKETSVAPSSLLKIEKADDDNDH